jgi:hypothetical protein
VYAAVASSTPAPEVPLSTLDRAIVNAVAILRPVTPAFLRRVLEHEYPTEGIALRLGRLVELSHLVVEHRDRRPQVRTARLKLSQSHLERWWPSAKRLCA